MAYTALYRKFRPAVFDDVKGQDHIVTTLRNQLEADRLGHAYLFCGTRGTGKTTIAKIFARAVNCEHPVNGSPCGTCPTCQAIASGSVMNVIEIDAASNNGVDNIREIVDEVSYSPTQGKYKVYIIDEVHMLSIGAFNALLKTLEEPPSYVIFILATTEVHKIPITILSRCQRYDFHRITIETIADRLRDLMTQEQVDVEERALRYIARTADGSMRDALSLMDQCIAFHFGETLTFDMALEVLGAVDTAVFSDLLRQIHGGDVRGCMDALETVVSQGRELAQFVTDFTWYLRNLLLIKTSEDLEDVVDVSTENMLRLKEEAEMISVDSIMRYIRIFSELSGQIRYAAQKRILIEVALIKLCRPQMEGDVASLTERIRALEDKVEQGIKVTAVQVPAAPQPDLPKAPLPKAVSEDIKAVIQSWPAIMAGAGNPLKTYLGGSRLSLVGEDQLALAAEEGLFFDEIQKNKEVIEQLISGYIEKEVSVLVRPVKNSREMDATYPDLTQLIQFDVEVTDSED